MPCIQKSISLKNLLKRHQIRFPEIRDLKKPNMFPSCSIPENSYMPLWATTHQQNSPCLSFSEKIEFADRKKNIPQYMGDSILSFLERLLE